MLNIFSNYKEQEEINRLEGLKETFNSAKKLNKKKCMKCGYCCNVRSCIPNPNELVKIAKYLKMKPITLINKYFAIDRMTGNGDYFVKPLGINIKDLAGKFIPSHRTFNEGKCTFLTDNNLCKIYSVRPESAKRIKCWNEEREDYDIMKYWKGNILSKKFKIDGSKLEDEESDDDEDNGMSNFAMGLFTNCTSSAL